MEILQQYFPNLTDRQHAAFIMLHEHIKAWNQKINLISRKDTDAIMTNHILHSLAIAKYITFAPGSTILDVGTGGGFPGLPLAILFPEVQFKLVDSIGKKIHVVNAFIEKCPLKNASAEQIRAEQVTGKFDFVVSRAVAALPKLMAWSRKSIATTQRNDLKNGMILLKGGDLSTEFKGVKAPIMEEAIHQWFQEPFFETKKLIYIPLQ
ncbi:MAG: 16S rRNA (guanine(527)-N(7))-methyltransferase RsmG [Bacteroidetes bacterium]|nr:MAG: 16S rRNA (guanine(527)-N(7))-methyltransferase RsmG [Bacteroidota bacterium]